MTTELATFETEHSRYDLETTCASPRNKPRYRLVCDACGSDVHASTRAELLENALGDAAHDAGRAHVLSRIIHALLRHGGVCETGEAGATPDDVASLAFEAMDVAWTAQVKCEALAELLRQGAFDEPVPDPSAERAGDLAEAESSLVAARNMAETAARWQAETESKLAELKTGSTGLEYEQ
jgi:hypothetical protein